MAKFAPVAGIKMLDDIWQSSKAAFGSYHLLLAHHTQQNKDHFHEVFSEATQYKNGFFQGTIIMDNSIVELGGSVNDDVICEALEPFMYPSANTNWEVIPVLPDVMGNGKETREVAMEGLQRWSSADGFRMPNVGGYMLVAQGSSGEDFCRTINHFFIEKEAETRGKIRWVGIPRVLVKILGSRSEAIRYVQAIAPHVSIHLLGFSDDPIDDILCARMPGVTGIDSAVPVRCQELFTPLSVLGSRPDNWLEEATLEEYPHALKNIMQVRKWIDCPNAR